MRKRLFIFCLLSFFLFGCSDSSIVLLKNQLVKNQLDLSRVPCRYNTSGRYNNGGRHNNSERISFRCYLASRQDGVEHSYHVTVLSPELRSTENQKKDHDREALLAIPGGPGQGGQTKDGWVESWAEFLLKNAIPYDLIVFDPPGTIGSDINWRCDKYERLALKLAGENLSFTNEVDQLAPVLNRCLEQYDQVLKNQGFSESGLLGLSSIEYAKRLSLLMEALPYDAFHLLGTSYGTRVAMLLAEQKDVATLTLDSVYPFSRGTLIDTPALLSHSEQIHHYQYRAMMASSSNSNSDYDSLFVSALQELKLRPQFWHLERWDGEQNVKFVLNPSRLNDVAFSVLYDESMLEYFYKGLNNIGDKQDTLRWILEDFVTNSFDPTFSTLTFIATECSDNRRVAKDQYMLEANRYPDLKEDWEAIYNQDVCAHPLFSEAPTINDKPYADKPTIVFSGELDPVTPTFWTEELLDNMPRLKVVTVRGVGHAVLGSSKCDAASLVGFWETRDISSEILCDDKTISEGLTKNRLSNQ